MTDKVYVIRADWDAEARVWFAYSDDVPGLATGADTMEALMDKLKIVVPELLEENSLLPKTAGEIDVPISVLAQRIEHIRRSA
jgi:predicted RNase H-like HicB family nuclease